MLPIVKKQISQNVTCQTNVTEFLKFTATPATGASQQFVLLAKDHLARTNGRGIDIGLYITSYSYVGGDLIQACAAPTNTSVTMNCIACEKPAPCEFNSANFVALGDPVAVGTGTVQLGRLVNNVAASSAFELCAKDSLPAVVAAELAASPIQSSSASISASGSKKLTLAAAVFVAAMLVVQNA